MGYVAVKGGKEAIRESSLRLEYERIKAGNGLKSEDIQQGMKPLVDQVMSESSLYNEELASLALKQARGSMEEAVFLLRAHRSTLPRLYYTTVSDPADMFVKRRISSSFKDIPGGQLLGSSADFTQRFLDFDLLTETEEELNRAKNDFESRLLPEETLHLRQLPKVVDYLRDQGLFRKLPENNQEPDDITKKSLRFPCSRSQRLQSLTRGQTGAVTSFGYAEMRGYGISSHPNIGELRVGDLPLHVSALRQGSEEESYYIGSIEITEVESLFSADVVSDQKKTEMELAIGYGICYGQNETKAIAMSILDHSLENPIPDVPTTDEEFVLLHIDSVESTGFISHLKLPHYVTFQSRLDRMRTIKDKEDRYEL